MSEFRTLFDRIAAGIGERLEATAARSPRRHPEAPRINAYHGYANRTQAWVSGRLLRNAPVGAAAPEDPWWRNVVNTYRRMETDETPGIRLRIELGSAAVQSVSDDEGHFRATIPLAEPLPADRRWHEATIRVVPPRHLDWTVEAVAAPVLLPARTAAFAVISDVDDTIIETRATQPLRLLRNVLFENARTRPPFPGVADFYTGLERGLPGRGPNPLFYLSSSPWNLHDVLVEFLEHNGIPVGPLLLKDWGLPERGTARPDHREHKLARIEHLLAAYPDLPFILIGDNGQADPVIYEEAAGHFPGRILAVYIREVGGDERRRETTDRVGHALGRRGVSFVPFRETGAAAAHAAGRGWIAAPAGAPREAGDAARGAASPASRG
jgi:phosphatidate phosphatase APP1